MTKIETFVLYIFKTGHINKALRVDLVRRAEKQLSGVWGKVPSLNI
jgi:hypothetical protein